MERSWKDWIYSTVFAYNQLYKQPFQVDIVRSLYNYTVTLCQNELEAQLVCDYKDKIIAISSVFLAAI